jgi:lycopene beta-cyclase
VREVPGRSPTVAILGAGLAGSSLAYLLYHRGYRGQVHLFDSRRRFDREQRWCSWGPVPEELSWTFGYSWDRWQVIWGHRRAVVRLPERPYREIYAPSFFERVLEELAGSSNVHLHLGSEVRSVECHNGRLAIELAVGSLGTDLAFDSRPAAVRETSSGSGPRLRQSFVGRVVSTTGAAFDPATVTLMDFGEEEDISFTYVLPFTSDRALVESTVFAPRPLPAASHRSRIGTYLRERGISSYTVASEESGDLPLATNRFSDRLCDRHHVIGAAGGALRPSSGYGLVRIMRRSEEIAEALLRGRPVPRSREPARRRLLDEVFLETVASSPDLARRSFVEMFSCLRPEVLVRFLSDEASVFDELRMVAVLPKAPFLHAGLRTALRRTPWNLQA